MATVYPVLLTPESAQFGTASFPELRKIQGTNFPIMILAFDAANDEWVYWKFQVRQYGSGNISIAIDWYALTGGSGNIVWQAKIAAITPDTDTQDVETDGMATVNSVTDTHLGTVNKRLHRCTITLSNLDSLANSDWVVLAIGRNGSSGSDTLAGDAGFTLAQLSWSDT